MFPNLSSSDRNHRKVQRFHILWSFWVRNAFVLASLFKLLLLSERQVWTVLFFTGSLFFWHLGQSEVPPAGYTEASARSKRKQHAVYAALKENHSRLQVLLLYFTEMKNVLQFDCWRWRVLIIFPILNWSWTHQNCRLGLLCKSENPWLKCLKQKQCLAVWWFKMR